MNEAGRIWRAAGVVGGATLLSRVLGFVRDMVIAGFFGAGFATDAFFVAFRIPNLLRRLFAEGALSMALIPVLTDTLGRGGRQDMRRLARSALHTAAAVLVVLTALGMIAAPGLVRMLAPGFAASPEKMDLAVSLTRIMMPYVLCIGLVSVAMGILNTLGHFAAPALAPALLNLAMIGAVLSTVSWLETPVRGLAYGVAAGGLFQLALQLPFLARAGVRFWSAPEPMHPGIVRVCRLMGPAAFGAAVYQVNLLVGSLLASLLPQGSISYLYYADRLVQFPLGVFAVALATAVMPTLSRQSTAADLPGLRETFCQSMGLVLFISVPAMVGLMVTGDALVGLLFQRGAFDPASARLTASALVYYSTGLWASAAVRIVLATCYALEETRAPVMAGAAAVGCNLILGWALMGPLGFQGLALAAAVASMVNLFLLGRTLNVRLGGLNWSAMARSAVKIAVCAAVMGMGVRLLIVQTAVPGFQSFAHRLTTVAVSVAAGVVIFVGLAWCVRCPELAMARRLLTRNGAGT
ncbi:MAG: murein biosynthesis integral membrane protein MurJ [Desulfobacterales bacterium]|nr:murein biosynthesis integral membrane protein MurJ [Desulfobacterales bacterium]